MNSRECALCRKVFTPKRGKQRYCSYSCSGSVNAKLGKVTPAAIRFWSKVKKASGCWLWTGAVGKVGYGNFGTGGGVTVGAHRFSYELHCGPVPDGKLVLHRCDNRLCVRPDHLFLGTHKDNTADASNKGRLARGERQGGAKLTADQARTIYTSEKTQDQLAAEFGVSQAQVYRIRAGRAWAHVTSSIPPARPA
jgi:hypothetical protein